jgi:hypothetical protein
MYLQRQSLLMASLLLSELAACDAVRRVHKLPQLLSMCFTCLSAQVLKQECRRWKEKATRRVRQSLFSRECDNLRMFSWRFGARCTPAGMMGALTVAGSG